MKVEVLVSPNRERIREAYLRMVHEARYRPAAPSDGFGYIQLSEEELADPLCLEQEAGEYADRFLKEENGLEFHIGCSNYATNRAFVFTIEAARLLCAGDGAQHAMKLLQMAIADIQSTEERGEIRSD